MHKTEENEKEKENVWRAFKVRDRRGGKVFSLRKIRRINGDKIMSPWSGYE